MTISLVLVEQRLMIGEASLHNLVDTGKRKTVTGRLEWLQAAVGSV